MSSTRRAFPNLNQGIKLILSGSPHLTSQPVLLPAPVPTPARATGYNSIYTLMAVYNDSQLDMLINSHAGTIVGQVGGQPVEWVGGSEVDRVAGSLGERGGAAGTG